MKQGKLGIGATVTLMATLAGCGSLYDRSGKPEEPSAATVIAPNYNPAPQTFIPELLPSGEVDIPILEPQPYPEEVFVPILEPMEETPTPSPSPSSTPEVSPTPSPTPTPTPLPTPSSTPDPSLFPICNAAGSEQASPVNLENRKLYVRQPLNTTSALELPLESIVTNSGNVIYAQKLTFEDGFIDFTEDGNNLVGDVLFFPERSPIFTYNIDFDDFNTGLLTQWNPFIVEWDGPLELDLTGKTLRLLNHTYNILQASLEDDGVLLDLMRYGAIGKLNEGETGCYTLFRSSRGLLYEITPFHIQQGRVKLNVNGELTSNLTRGEKYTLADGSIIGVRDVFSAGNEEGARFILSNQNVVLHDDDITDALPNTQGVKINGDTISDASVNIQGSISNNQVILNGIEYLLNAGAFFEGDLYIPPGQSLSQHIGEPEALLGFDVGYSWLRTQDDPMSFDISRILIKELDDNNYGIEASTDVPGVNAYIPLVEIRDNKLLWGENNDSFIFTEGSIQDQNCNHTLCDEFGNFFNIDEDDYFMITTPSGITDIFTYNDFDPENNKFFFRNAETGQREITTTSSDLEGVLASATFKFGGHGFDVYISSSEGYPIAVNQNGRGEVDGKNTSLIVNGVGKLELGNQHPHDYSQREDGTTEVRVRNRHSNGEIIEEDAFFGMVRTPNRSFDYTPVGFFGDELIFFEIRKVGEGSNASVKIGTAQRIVATSGGQYEEIEYFSMHHLDEEELCHGMSNYGVFVEAGDCTGTPETGMYSGTLLNIEYPDSQVYGTIDISVGNE
jgi:hypothetical protein